MPTSLFEVDSKLPQCKSDLFELINPCPLDSDKETVCMITSNLFTDDFDYIFGFCYELYNTLKTKYNVVIIGKEKKSRRLTYEGENVLALKQSGYNNLKAKLRRKAEDENNVPYNMNLLAQEIELAISDFNVSKIIYTNDVYNLLPLTTYYKEYKELANEFFDYVGTDEDEIKQRLKNIHTFNRKYDDKVSIIAFSMYFKNIFMKVADEFIKKNPKLSIYNFVIDPAGYTFLHEDLYGIKTTRYYFEDDTRGTRKFQKFPIAQLQHITYERNYFTNFESHIFSFEQKKKNLFFIGSIIQDKGPRKELWDTCLRNFKDENSGLWVPLRANGVFKNKRHEKSVHAMNAVKKAKEEYAELYESIKEHDIYQGHMLPSEIRKTIRDYRYGLVLRCTSHNDSLNYRPMYYASMGILPILDKQYDPTYLMIPKEIQDYLVIENHQDIQNRIDYFNDNPDVAKRIIKDLQELFEIDKYINYNREELDSEILKYFTE